MIICCGGFPAPWLAAGHSNFLLQAAQAFVLSCLAWFSTKIFCVVMVFIAASSVVHLTCPGLVTSPHKCVVVSSRNKLTKGQPWLYPYFHLGISTYTPAPGLHSCIKGERV